MLNNTIPEYLQPALAQLERPEPPDCDNARLTDETVKAIYGQSSKCAAQADETTLMNRAQPLTVAS